MTKIRRGRWRGGERGEGGEEGGGGKGGGAHRVLDHTYPELSVARATLVSSHEYNLQTNLNTDLKL